MVYQTIYDLLFNGIFSGATAVGYAELVCTICATIGTLFVVAIPFFVVYKVICFIFRG